MSKLEFNQLLLNNADFLKPFAVNLTRDSEAAKDLYQETLFKAIANKEKYNVGTNIKAWLFTIMRNIFINDYRRKSRQQTIFDSTQNDFLLDYNQSAIANTAEGKFMNSRRYLKLHFSFILKVISTMKFQISCRNRWVP